ncbi:MAG: TonB-dependent receptor [Gemmatimonadota bacterium]
MIAGALRPARNGLVLLTLSSGPLLAQVDGKVTGVVSDLDTGLPLVGAQVIVEGTNLGNVTNADGFYFINQLPVGIQRISGQYLGYKTTTYETRILAGQTSTIDFALPSEVLQAAAIVAIVEREPLVVRDNVVSKSRFTAEEARGLPVDDIGSVITLGAGIYKVQPRGFSGLRAFIAGDLRNVGSGYIVRGGRVTESATYVDGVLVTDLANQLNAGEVGNFAVEEADVITGGFGAQFGHAQSGIVNIVTRAGGTEFHGNLRFTTDGRFGTNGYDITERDAFERERCCGFNALQASLGGPILPEKLTFFGSLEATGAADIDPHAAGFNPAEGTFNSGGSTNTILPGNRGDRTRLQVKLTSFLAEGSRLTGTYLFTRDQQENYNENRGFFQHLSERATRIKTYDVILGYDQTIFQTSERNLNLQIRGNFHQTLLHLGTPRNPLSAAEILDLVGAACGVDCQVDRHAFDDDFLNYRFGDIEFFFEDSMPMLILGLKRPTSENPDPIFGIANAWDDGGFNARFNHRNERRYGIRLDLDSQLTRIHRAKMGFEWSWINLATRNGFLDGGGGEVYDVDPQVGALYVQDRLDFGDLVIDLGLRWDHWNPSARVPVFPGVVNCEITRFAAIGGCREVDAPFLDAPTRSALSPRMGVAHPITDETQVRLSYGRFQQLPELRHFFQGHLSDSKTLQGFFYGNPNLDYIETTAFEVGITHLLSSNLVLDVVGYNRDRRGAIRADLFPPQTLDLRVGEVAVFTNSDNGNVKGVDITVGRRFANYWSTNLAWSLQWARGTTSSPVAFVTSGFAFLFDPNNPTQFLSPPTKLSAEDFDRLHAINWQFNLSFPTDFRAGTLPGALFRDLSLYLVYNAHSGEPYTRVDPRDGGLLEDFNRSRLPWVHSGDLRVVRGFDLATGLHLDVFAVVKNFLDTRNILNVHRTTGQPDRAGLEERNSKTPSIPVNFFEEGSSLNFPVALEDIRLEFRAGIARQDLDGDGLITLAEGQEALRRALISINDWPHNYGEPRQVRFGVELRF